MIFGYLVLSADRQPSSMSLSEISECNVYEGHHVVGKRRGNWLEATSYERRSLYLPQRYKKVEVTATDALDQICTRLESLDSEMENARQLYKLNRMLSDIERPFAAVVNNVGTATNESGTFYLLARSTPMYVNLLVDVEDHSVRIVWSSFDLKSSLQDLKQFRYLMYPMPTLMNRPLFMDSQRACSRWWKFTNTFGTSGAALLRSCNALEMYLYKDPSLAKL